MRKAIITLGILSVTLLLLLSATACSKEKGITPQSSGNANTENNAQTTQATSISGDISKVDSLNSELDNADLQNVDAELSDINW